MYVANGKLEDFLMGLPAYLHGGFSWIADVATRFICAKKSGTQKMAIACCARTNWLVILGVYATVFKVHSVFISIELHGRHDRRNKLIFSIKKREIN